MNTKTKLTKARTRLLLSQPFFASLALRMKAIESPHIETMATDGRHLYYRAEYVDGLSMDELVGVLAHEVMHPACNHHTRRAKRDLSRWNIAADYAINPLLLDSGFVLPEGILVDPAYAGLSAEEIYRRLPTPPQANDGNQNPDAANTPNEPGQSNPPPTGESGDDPSNDPQGPCPDPGKCGAIIDATDALGRHSPIVNSTSESQWRQAIAQAAAVAKAAGSMPAALERLVETIIRPPIDVRELLRRFIEMSAKQDYTWSPPNRRFVYQGLYLPSCRSQSMPPILIAIDTSGSIDDGEMRLFAGMLTEILESCMPDEIYVVYCDTEIQNVQTFTPFNLPLELNAKGKGGTDFRPPFQWLEDNPHIHPACVLYLTDLQCRSFPDEPACPTLWVTTSTPEFVERYGTPPFGEIVHLESAQ